MSDHTPYERPLQMLTNALREIAGSDCWGPTGDERDATEGCDCVPCTARRALIDASDWRFYTTYKQQVRLRFNARERKIREAWKKYLESAGGGGPDYRFAQILWEDTTPSVRDWYVAGCVVQWLATNVGMGVLDEAGFKYGGWDEDRGEDDAHDDAKHEVTVLRLRRVDKPKDPKAPVDPKAPLHRPPLYGVVNRRGQVVTTGNAKQLEAFAKTLLETLKQIATPGSDPGEF